MFDPDHRYMDPPSLRISKRMQNDGGSLVCVWDFRIAQPNVSHLSADAIHSLEHFIGALLPERCPGIVNVAPLGCQTGFYLVTVDLDDFDTMAGHIAGVLEAVLDAQEVPLANEVQCGWAENHSLRGAQNIAGWILKRRKDWATVLLE